MRLRGLSWTRSLEGLPQPEPESLWDEITRRIADLCQLGG